MSAKGVKRASPGADEEKNPLGVVELSDEDAKRLGDIQNLMQRAEILLGEWPALARPFVRRRGS